MIGKAVGRIQAARGLATKAEQKVIDGILSISPDEIIYLSISDFAARPDVADATPVRFCKKIGCNGFQDFKLHLSREAGMMKWAAKLVVNRFM